MKMSLFSRIGLLNLVIGVFFLICSTQSAPALAAPETPTYFGSLSSSAAYLDTIKITLTIDDLGGSAPPSSKWYDPDGVQTDCCSGGQTVRQYVYSYGSLIQVKDYFYIKGKNREVGLYSVKVGTVINKTFTLKYRAVYLPFVTQ